jgi:bacillithiol biosynthesis deacetylase BshB1
MNTVNPQCDVLCISPHSDDAEIALGGTLAQLSDRGRRVWLCDLTRGELGSNGTTDDRWREAQAASDILDITGRVQLEQPDGFISVTESQQVEAVAAVIRSLRPRWVITAPRANRHPDHQAIVPLVEKSVFMARLAAWSPPMPSGRCWPDAASLPEPAERWLVEAVFHVCRAGEEPSLVFDVTEHWERKVSALRAYKSQFENADGQRKTLINDPAFLAEVERWALSWGFRRGCRYAEALRSTAAPLVTDLPTERWA